MMSRRAAAGAAGVAMLWMLGCTSPKDSGTLPGMTDQRDGGGGRGVTDAGQPPAMSSGAGGAGGTTTSSGTGGTGGAVTGSGTGGTGGTTTSSGTGGTGGMTTGSGAGGTGGQAGTPAALTLTVASGSTPAIGQVMTGQNVAETFLVTNVGQQASSAVTVRLTTTAGSGFTLPPPEAGECVSGTTVLAGGSSCRVVVYFTAVVGAQTATLSVSAAMGGSPPSLTLTGTGVTPAALVADPTAVDLGNVEVGVAVPTSVRLTNTGGSPSGVPALSNTNEAELTIANNGCAAGIAPGASCTLGLRFTAAAGGLRQALVRITATTGLASFTVTAVGSYRLTVTRAGAGAGVATTLPAGITCGTACTALFPGGTGVTVQARTTNGSGAFFSGYGGNGPCAGPARDCAITMNAPAAVTATFSPMTANLVFATSIRYPTSAGSAAAYDGNCNQVATGAGINDADGLAYVAVVSDAASSVLSRLGSTARGWVRMDGLPFADTLGSLFTNGAVLNSVRYTEQGTAFDPDNLTLSGTSAAGAALPGQTCNNWTSTAASVVLAAGLTEGGPRTWTDGPPTQCGLNLGLTCLGRRRTATIGPIVTAGKRIWVAGAQLGVGLTTPPSQLCQAQLPTGATAAAALLATTTTPAAAVLVPTANYVRPDGTFVGTGSQLAAGGRLASGVWQTANGTYLGPTALNAVWTGSASPGVVGTLASTCGNWSDISQTAGQYGDPRVASVGWWANNLSPCNQPASVVCVQTAP